MLCSFYAWSEQVHHQKIIFYILRMNKMKDSIIYIHVHNQIISNRKNGGENQMRWGIGKSKIA